MPEVISNTSPIQYLYQTNLLNLLPTLYEQIILPQAVVTELTEGSKLGVCLPDLTALPWVKTQQASNTLAIAAAPDLLGAGELEAIALALETQDALVLLDDALARNYAKQLKIKFTGTLGVLLRAKQFGHLPLILPVLEQLDRLGFRLDQATRDAVLKLAGEI